MIARKRWLPLVTFGALAAAVMLVSVRRHPAAISVSVRYLGSTNYLNWGDTSMFAVTNRSASIVRRQGWLGVEDRNTGTTMVGMNQDSRVLGPGEGEVVMLQTPTNGGAWRLMLTVEEIDLRRRVNEAAGEAGVAKHLPARFRAMPQYSFTSDWVQP